MGDGSAEYVKVKVGLAKDICRRCGDPTLSSTALYCYPCRRFHPEDTGDIKKAEASLAEAQKKGTTKLKDLKKKIAKPKTKPKKKGKR